MMSLFPMPGAVILAVDDTPSHLRLLRNLFTSVGGRLAAHNVRVIHRDIKPSTVRPVEHCWRASTFQSEAGGEARTDAAAGVVKRPYL